MQPNFPFHRVAFATFLACAMSSLPASAADILPGGSLQTPIGRPVEPTTAAAPVAAGQSGTQQPVPSAPDIATGAPRTAVSPKPAVSTPEVSEAPAPTVAPRTDCAGQSAYSNARAALDASHTASERAAFGSAAGRCLRLPVHVADADALWLVGSLELQGIGTPRDLNAAFVHIRGAAEKHQPDAAYWTAHQYLQQKPLLPWMQLAAVHYLNLAARAGHGAAMTELAADYRSGQGVIANASVAAFWAARAAATAPAHTVVLQTPGNALPVTAIVVPAAAGATPASAGEAPADAAKAPVTPARAATIALASIEQPKASTTLAAVEVNGAGMVQHLRDQVTITTLTSDLKQARIQVDTLTQERDATRVELAQSQQQVQTAQAATTNQIGLTSVALHQEESAAQSFSQAAAQGDVAAIANLGLLYLNGRGVPRDADRAIALLEKAAGAGSATAARNLERIYAQGLASAPDADLARRWGAQADAMEGGQRAGDQITQAGGSQ